LPTPRSALTSRPVSPNGQPKYHADDAVRQGIAAELALRARAIAMNDELAKRQKDREDKVLNSKMKSDARRASTVIKAKAARAAARYIYI
jgi:hypothetical protein